MRKIKEILRLKWDLRLSNREIAVSVKISPSTVGDCIKRAKRANLTWPLPCDLDDEKLEEMLYSPPRSRTPAGSHDIDWSYVHKELRRKGVTREILWDEYKQQHPQGINYSRFCELYREWRQKIDCCIM